MKYTPIALLLVILLSAGVACDNPLAPLSTIVPSESTPSLAPNQVGFTKPFTSYLRANDKLPGSAVKYIGQSGDTYELTIDGQTAKKKVGDSIIWRGPTAPGISLDYNLRILGVILGQFEAAGTLTVIIDDAAPVSVTLPVSTTLHFDNLVINSSAKIGKQIPGTDIGYLHKTEQGAQLSGVEGYPYRALGDSVDWSGQIKPNAWLKLNVRVLDFTDTELKVVGTGEIWINQ